MSLFLKERPSKIDLSLFLKRTEQKSVPQLVDLFEKSKRAKSERATAQPWFTGMLIKQHAARSDSAICYKGCLRTAGNSSPARLIQQLLELAQLPRLRTAGCCWLLGGKVKNMFFRYFNLIFLTFLPSGGFPSPGFTIRLFTSL